MGSQPAILHLGIAVVLANDTVKSNGIAHSRLGGHNIVTSLAVCIVSTVDIQRITGLIGNEQIAVLLVVDLGNNTGHIVSACSMGVMLLGNTQSHRFGNGQHAVGSGILFNGLLRLLGRLRLRAYIRFSRRFRRRSLLHGSADARCACTRISAVCRRYISARTQQNYRTQQKNQNRFFHRQPPNLISNLSVL